MIEKDGEALKYIIENIDNLGFTDRCRAYKNDVVRAVEILGRKKEKFDIIFMDPPYQDNITTKVLKAIDKADILADDGLIICEHHYLRIQKIIQHLLEKTDERKYNKKILTFFTK